MAIYGIPDVQYWTGLSSSVSTSGTRALDMTSQVLPQVKKLVKTICTPDIETEGVYYERQRII